MGMRLTDREWKIRPIGKDVSLEELFPNVRMRSAFRRAIKKTTVDFPILQFTSLAMERAIMSVLQSYVSDDFSKEFMLAAAGHPMNHVNYVLMATFERYGELETQKVRVMVVPEALLKALPSADSLTFERPHHVHRLRTLGLMNVHWTTMDSARRASHAVEIPVDKTA